jgi:hypothetical protein
MYSYNCTAYRFSDTLSAALPLVKQYGLRGMPHWRWYAKSGAVRSSILLQPAKLHRNGLASSPHLRGEASFAGFLKALHVENVDRSLEEVWNAARGCCSSERINPKASRNPRAISSGCDDWRRDYYMLYISRLEVGHSLWCRFLFLFIFI